ncbi:MAG: ComEC/Rec2 family competence protein [Clostridia bacterium]|nr:ComEC/Rec2 family competence protein [Clostridia bacterium]
MGIWAGARFFWRPGVYLAGMAVSILALLLLRAAKERRVAGVMGVFFFLGALLAGNAAHPVLPQAGVYQVTGVATENASPRENGSVALYLDETAVGSDDFSYALGRVYWTYYPTEEDPFLPEEGDRVSFAGRLYAPNGQMNPYGFDFRMFLLEKGAVAGISGAQNPEIVDHPGRGLRSVSYRARQALVKRVRAVFGAGSALPEALLLGVKEQLPDEVSRGFANAGVAHLLAVSGLHVALFAGALMLPLRRLMGPRGRMAVLGAFLLAYCALLDFSAPVVRASLLLMLAQGQRIVRRAPDGVTGLAAAFLILLLFRPLSLFSASFQLSFCAVLGMAAFTPAIRWQLEKRGLRHWPVGLGRMIGANLGVTLPTAQIFHRFSLIGLAINPLACLMFSVLLPLYALTLALGSLYLPLGRALAVPINAVSSWIVGGVEALGALPFASLRVPFLPWYGVAAVVIALALASRYTVWPGRKKAAAAVLLLILSFGAWRLSLPRQVQYIQLAMGQADSALILDGRETIVIDAGDYGGDLADYLLSTGRRADHLFITHLHSDHCLGIRQLLDERIPIGQVYLPEGAEEQQIDGACLALIGEIAESGVPVKHLAAGDQFHTDRTSMEVTWPVGETVQPGQDANRYCLTMLWDLAGVRVLTTGDLTGAYELYAARDAEILKVPHHGSKTSTGADFLQAVTPDLALITGSGRENAALPNGDTIARLEERGIPWYDTGTWGALTVTVQDGRATLTPFVSRKEDR